MERDSAAVQGPGAVAWQDQAFGGSAMAEMLAWSLNLVERERSGHLATEHSALFLS